MSSVQPSWMIRRSPAKAMPHVSVSRTPSLFIVVAIVFVTGLPETYRTGFVFAHQYRAEPRCEVERAISSNHRDSREQIRPVSTGPRAQRVHRWRASF